MKNKKNNLSAIDFFCGAGGVTCGFKQAGINVMGGIDIDKNCKETYETNNDVEFLNIDISKLKKEKLTSVFNIRKNQDNLIFIGCSPCQYFSNIKTDKSKSRRTRYLLTDFQEFIDYYNPGHIFIENVTGIDKKTESPLQNFKQFLIKKKYAFYDSAVNAKFYGIPQNRRRYVLIASRIKMDIKLPKGDKKKIKTVRDAIGDYDIFKPISINNFDSTGFQHSTANLSELNLKRINITPHNGGDRRCWPEKLKLESCKNHSGHYDVYGRMFWNKPSPTITTKFRSLSNGRYGHPEQDRAISIREGATIQSFPLEYKFIANSQVAIAKMIGNAVPPLLAKSICRSFFND